MFVGLGISLTTEPIWFSFTENLPLVPETVYINFGEGYPNSPNPNFHWKKYTLLLLIILKS